MAERVRKRIEQPSEETGKRNTVLVWGAVLGVLAGLMLGVYALPPILRHYYGETKVAADEFYSGEGKLMKVVNIGQVSEPLGEAAAGMRREDYFVSISVVSQETWRPPRPSSVSNLPASTTGCRRRRRPSMASHCARLRPAWRPRYRSISWSNCRARRSPNSNRRRCTSRIRASASR